MKLIGCKDQGEDWFRVEYSQLSSSDEPREQSLGRAMLAFIKVFENAPDKRQAWALTSMRRLCLLARNRYDPPWPVVVEWSPSTGYQVEYDHDVFFCQSISVNETVEFVFEAMEKSQAWKGRGMYHPYEGECLCGGVKYEVQGRNRTHSTLPLLALSTRPGLGLCCQCRHSNC